MRHWEFKSIDELSYQTAIIGNSNVKDVAQAKILNGLAIRNDPLDYNSFIFRHKVAYHFERKLEKMIQFFYKPVTYADMNNKKWDNNEIYNIIKKKE